MSSPEFQIGILRTLFTSLEKNISEYDFIAVSEDIAIYNKELSLKFLREDIIETIKLLNEEIKEDYISFNL